jgi:hypothetical protein
MKIKEVSREEFGCLIQEETELAYKKATGLKVSNWSWWLSSTEYGTLAIPCIYTTKGVGSQTAYCVLLKKSKKCRLLPKGFHRFIKEGVQVSHASDVPCASMNLGITVRCYAQARNGDGTYHYYTTEHKVGKCPWKELELAYPLPEKGEKK